MSYVLSCRDVCKAPNGMACWSSVLSRTVGASPAQTHPGQIAFSRDGLLFFQCINNGVEVYSYPAMEVVAMLEGHTAPALGLALDQSGRCGAHVLCCAIRRMLAARGEHVPLARDTSHVECAIFTWWEQLVVQRELFCFQNRERSSGQAGTDTADQHVPAAPLVGLDK